MRAIDTLQLRLRSLFLRPRVEAELDAELAFHLDQLTAENIAAGMSPLEARQAARRAFGGVAQIQEECRDTWGIRWFERLVQDLSFALRTFRRSPTVTLVAVLSLALGIGANTGIFSLINSFLLRPLPVHDPAGLVAIGDPTRVNDLSEGTIRTDLFSYPLYKEISDRNRVFTGLFASGDAGRLTVGTDTSAPSGAETVRGRLVSGNFFSVLGVNALHGRTFTAQDDGAPGGAPFVVLSHQYWTRRFGGDPRAVGRTIVLDKHPFTIVGVTPPEFFGDIVGGSTDLWIPLSMQPQVNPGRNYLDRWSVRWLLLMGRLEPGASLARARAEINLLVPRLLAERSAAEIPPELLSAPEQLSVEVTPGGSGFSRTRREIAQPLLVLLAIVSLVLVVACANIANLLLERAMARQKEMALRLAVGAGRRRLIRQLLTESALLAGVGGALGLLFAFWAGKLLLRLAGGSGSPAFSLAPDLRVLAFTAGVSLVTALLFGLAPALRATRVELAPALKEGARSLAGEGSGARWSLGKLLVVGQFAVSLLLVVGAGLFVRTLQNLGEVDLGYPRDGLLLLRVDPVGAGYPEARLAGLPRELTERLRAVPGVEGVTVSANGLFSGSESDTTIRIEGWTAAEDPGIHFDRVGAGYFGTIGIPLLRGRDIELRDRAGAPGVAVINEAMAEQYFAGRDPLGKRLVIPRPDTAYEIVGVARNARGQDLRGPVEPRFYLPLQQSGDLDMVLNVMIRTRASSGMIEPIRQALREYDPNLPVRRFEPLTTLVDRTITTEKVIATLSTIFGVLALLLGAMGLYGVLSYTVARRRNEIGIRMAMGARRASVLWMVLRETLLLALAGIAVGVPLALAAGQALSSRLFGLSAADPLTLVTAVTILLLVALLAGLIPGSRATRVDPVQALRYE